MGCTKPDASATAERPFYKSLCQAGCDADKGRQQHDTPALFAGICVSGDRPLPSGHDASEHIAFLGTVDLVSSGRLDEHLLLDDLATHSGADVRYGSTRSAAFVATS